MRPPATEEAARAASDSPPRRAGRLARAVALGVLLVAGVRGASAGEALEKVQQQFKEAIKRVAPATVVCIGHDAPEGTPASSSGVIVSKKGLVLSDGDAGYFVRDPKDRRSGVRPDLVDVRVPNPKGGFTVYVAKVVLRVLEIDSTLLRIQDPPSSGFPSYVPVGDSEGLEVGDFTFVMGNAFGLASESASSLTAGVVAALSPAPRGAKGGRHEFVYTSAAVNPGVNGGPMVDVEGRLVATISTWVTPVLAQESSLLDPYQFLGKAIPVQRIRAAYGALPEAAELFAEPPPAKVKTSHTAALETAFHQSAQKAYPSVVSLEVKRTAPVSLESPHERSKQNPHGKAVPRYRGPVTGIVASPEGWIVTSLYNLANVGTLEVPSWVNDPELPPPPEATVEGSLAQIEAITAHLPDGRSLPARRVGYDVRTGTALLKVDAPATQPGIAPYSLPSLEPAPADSLVEGRFVLALGNPFGATRNVSPLLSVGILSKQHPENAAAPWRGEWQTDAGVTDANAGGAVVDLHGRLVGMLTLWSPVRHGRNSGIAFVVPWEKIRAAIPEMKEGKVASRGFLGVRWKGGTKGVPLATIEAVVPDSPAAKAGLQAGDRIVRVGEDRITSIMEAMQQIGFSFAGETVRLGIERDGREIEVEVVLGTRPPPSPPPPEKKPEGEMQPPPAPEKPETPGPP